MTTVQMNDQLLRQYVDGIFQRYDLDHSNTLTLNQLAVFFNDLLGARGAQHKMTMQQVQSALRTMDTNSDGQITKTELYDALKRMNGASGLFGTQTSKVSQIPYQSTTPGIQYPNFSALTPKTPIAINTNQNLYAKPQQALTNNFVTSQIIPGTNTQTTQYQPTFMTVPQQQIVPFYTQPTFIPPPMAYGPPMFGGPMMMSPMMMGPMMPPMMGPMGPMGMMGMMGPRMGRFGPFGMGMGMNPLAALVGGLFGLF